MVRSWIVDFHAGEVVVDGHTQIQAPVGDASFYLLPGHGELRGGNTLVIRSWRELCSHFETYMRECDTAVAESNLLCFGRGWGSADASEEVDEKICDDFGR